MPDKKSKPKTRRAICWNCEEEFSVEVEGVLAPVVVVRVAGEASKQKPKQKLIVKCPHCGKENEVRV